MARRSVALTGLAVVLAVSVAVVAAVTDQGGARTPAAALPAAATATVLRTDLASTAELTGTLGFGDAVVLPRQGPGGTITALSAPGAVVRQGGTLYEIDGAPVVLMYGRRPAWRDLALGVTGGADVGQLERDLVALGDADPRTLTVDDTFTWATSAAVRRWQRASHQPVTGTVPLGRVVFTARPVRVVTAQQPLGAAVQPGQPVLTVTSTTAVVSLDVPVAQAHLVHLGDAVTVTLPAGVNRRGRVASISSVATGGSPNGAGGPPEGTPSQGPEQPQITAQVMLTSERGPADTAPGVWIDQAPVTVTVTDRRVRGVLAVPVTALVALAGGGYGVWVDQPGPRHLVAVTTGLFAAALVQVSGAGLAAGDAVEVPSS